MRSENSEPLTRLQMMHDHFNNVMKNYDEKELLEKIIPYSEITECDKKETEENPFLEETFVELDSVTVQFSKENNVNIFSIKSNDIGGFSLKDFVTYWRPKLNRNKCQQLDNNEGDQKSRELLTPSEIKQLIVGTDADSE